jgi:hypothetical protein
MLIDGEKRFKDYSTGLKGLQFHGLLPIKLLFIMLRFSKLDEHFIITLQNCTIRDRSSGSVLQNATIKTRSSGAALRN